MCDIKIRVINGTTHTNSRFGVTKPYKIFEKRTVAGEQVPLDFDSAQATPSDSVQIPDKEVIKEVVKDVIVEAIQEAQTIN